MNKRFCSFSGQSAFGDKNPYKAAVQLPPEAALLELCHQVPRGAGPQPKTKALHKQEPQNLWGRKRRTLGVSSAPTICCRSHSHVVARPRGSRTERKAKKSWKPNGARREKQNMMGIGKILS